jgi:MFS family permease
VTDATLGLQWHVLGMYAPSFVTGALISRFGLERIIGLGLALIIVAAVIGVAGISLWHFWIGLALLGVGWNFAFIGATTMVTTCHRPNERNKVQAFNDFLVFGSMAMRLADLGCAARPPANGLTRRGGAEAGGIIRPRHNVRIGCAAERA